MPRRIAPVRGELCPVPVSTFKVLVEKARKTAFRWDPLECRWIKAGPDAIYPGQVFWVPQSQGGYSAEFGWDPKSSFSKDTWIHIPPDAEFAISTEQDYDSDLLSRAGWQSIAEHTEDVCQEIEAIVKHLTLDRAALNALRVAARWHDWGKAHPIFQTAIKDEENGEGKRPDNRSGKRDIAKATPGSFWKKYCRKHFRHELASALGVLTLIRRHAFLPVWSELPELMQNLALYLIAAHHGKVRMSIRSMPGEAKPNQVGQLFARGVWDGDQLPAVDLGTNISAPAVSLDLSPMQMGRGIDGSQSWAERILGLRGHPDFGPLRLAFLEAVLRAGDILASRNADQKVKVTRA